MSPLQYTGTILLLNKRITFKLQIKKLRLQVPVVSLYREGTFHKYRNPILVEESEEKKTEKGITQRNYINVAFF